MPRKDTFIQASKGGLTMLAYPGDSSVLLAFTMDGEPEADFAGFAIRCTPPNSEPFYLFNRLNFTSAITATTKPEQRKFTPSNEAPFQKFRWFHVPREVTIGNYVYEGTTMHFKQGGGLSPVLRYPCLLK